MFVCLCTSVFSVFFVYVYECVSVLVYVRFFVLVWVCVRLFVFACVCVCVSVCVRLCVCKLTAKLSTLVKYEASKISKFSANKLL